MKNDEHEKAVMTAKEALKSLKMPMWAHLLFWAWAGFSVGSIIFMALT